MLETFDNVRVKPGCYRGLQKSNESIVCMSRRRSRGLPAAWPEEKSTGLVQTWHHHRPAAEDCQKLSAGCSGGPCGVRTGS